MSTTKSEDHWHFRAPRFLIVPHLHVLDVYYELDEVMASVIQLRSFGNDKEGKLELWGLRFDRRKSAIQGLAHHTVSLRDARLKALASFVRVVEEFGASADGVAEYEYETQLGKKPTSIRSMVHHGIFGCWRKRNPP